jgi:acetate kinase
VDIELTSTMPGKAVLALNSGSSSLKCGVFLAEGIEVQLLYRGAVEGIGTGKGKLWMRSADGRELIGDDHALSEQAEAIAAMADELRDLPLPEIVGIGHRVVHGGPELREHQRITPEVLKQLEAATDFAPLHVPVALGVIRASVKCFPGLAQFACFDTTFHRTLPEVAARFPLPERFWTAGVRRYGFHGISCESVIHRLGVEAGERTIVAHLGNGASITAIAHGKSVDTTMGLTPTGGIVMGSRCGDLDPGVLLHMLRTNESSVEGLEKLLDKESGLLGISGTSSDMRRLHERTEPQADLAIEMFCRSAKKAIASFVAVLEGVDLLVFTGGIGENDAVVRQKICQGLAPFGVALDAWSNAKNLATISSAASRVQVRIVPADEERQIARHVCRLLGEDR